MADVKISALPAATTYDTDDFLAGVDTSATASKKFPRSAIIAGVLGTTSGILKANGSGVLSAAAAGTDYLAPSGSGASLTGITAVQVGAEPTITGGTTSQYWRGDKSFATLNQAAVAGLATTDSPTFAGLTVGSTSGILKRTSGVLGSAVSGTDYEPPITAGTTSQYLKGDKSLGTLNQAAVAGLTTASSPAFAGLTVGSLSGLLKAATGVVAAAVSGTDYEPPITAGTTAQYLKGDKSLGTLNQAAVAGLTTASSPAFAGLTVGTLSGLLKASSGVVSAAAAGTDYLTTSYAGTSSIVTVGTITSGTWTGTTIAIANGGTGQTSASAAFNALSPVTTLGDVIYGSGTNTNARLAGNTTTTKKFLRQTGNGSISAIPAWDTIIPGDVPTMIASGASHAPGIVPDPPSSSGSTKFLREDATWAIPAGGSADKLGLTPTAVKTTGYTAASGDFVPCDSTAGGFTVTLPTAPGDGTLIAVKHVTQGSTNSITVSAGGSDVFNRAGGSASLTLPALARGVIVQYNAALAVWYVMTRDFGVILNADLTAPGSSGQIIYNSSNAFAGAANIAVGSSGQLALTPISDPGSPAAGNLWFDTAWKSLSILQAGVISRVGGVIWQATGAGTAVANTTSATSLLAGATTFGTLTIPANSLTVGKIIRPTLFGTWGATGTPNLTIKLTLGGVAIGQGTAAMAVNSGKAWAVEAVVGPCAWQVQSIGASGTIIGIGRVNPSGGAAITLNASGTALAAATTATIDTTTSLTIDFTAQWGAASASNTIQLLGGWFEILG